MSKQKYRQTGQVPPQFRTTARVDADKPPATNQPPVVDQDDTGDGEDEGVEVRDSTAQERSDLRAGLQSLLHDYEQELTELSIRVPQDIGEMSRASDRVMRVREFIHTFPTLQVMFRERTDEDVVREFEELGIGAELQDQRD